MVDEVLKTGELSVERRAILPHDSGEDIRLKRVQDDVDDVLA